MAVSIAGRVALVTGASSGFGEATALELARAGVKVGLSARRVDRLEALKARIEAAGGEALALTTVAEATAKLAAKRLVDLAEPVLQPDHAKLVDGLLAEHPRDQLSDGGLRLGNPVDCLEFIMIAVSDDRVRTKRKAEPFDLVT